MEKLSRRDHAVAELRRALLRAGHGREAVEQALERLGAARALDDERFASSYARSRLTHYGLGRNRIRAALRARGVSREQAERGLSQALGERPEREVLATVAARLFRHHARQEPRPRLAKVFAALLRRGFPVSLIREQLAALEPRCQDMLEGYGAEAACEPDFGAREPD